MQLQMICLTLWILAGAMVSCYREQEPPPPVATATRPIAVVTQSAAPSQVSPSVLPTLTASADFVLFPVGAPAPRQTQIALLIPCTSPSSVTPDENDPYSYLGYRSYGYGIPRDPTKDQFDGLMDTTPNWNETNSSPVYAISGMYRYDQFWIYIQKYLCRDQEYGQDAYWEIVDMMMFEKGLEDDEWIATNCLLQGEPDPHVFALGKPSQEVFGDSPIVDIKQVWRVDESSGKIQEIPTTDVTCTIYRPNP